MDSSVFEEYLQKTFYKEGEPFPSYQEMKQMEDAFISTLFGLKTSKNYQEYRYMFSFYGKQVIGRIGFCLGKIDEGNETPELKSYIASLTRIREALKSLDRGLYEKELRSRIQKGKHLRQIRKKVAIKEPAIKTEAEIATPHFKNINLDLDKIDSLFNQMVARKWLASNTKPEVFRYYFSGKGDEPTEKLIWRAKTKLLLAVLLSELEQPVEWKVVGDVFENINAKSLKSSFSNCYRNSVDAYNDYLSRVQMVTENL